MIKEYSWNIEEWVKRRVNGKRRTPLNISWLKSLLKPVQDLANEFSLKCQDWDYRIRFNSQQKVLSTLLNNLFDPDMKRIRIVTTSDVTPPVVIYDDQENPDHAIIYDEDENAAGPVLYDEDEIEANYDFKVFAPNALSSSENRIRAWVERYRIGSKKFTIIFE